MGRYVDRLSALYSESRLGGKVFTRESERSIGKHLPSHSALYQGHHLAKVLRHSTVVRLISGDGSPSVRRDVDTIFSTHRLA